MFEIEDTVVMVAQNEIISPGTYGVVVSLVLPNRNGVDEVRVVWENGAESRSILSYLANRVILVSRRIVEPEIDDWADELVLEA